MISHDLLVPIAYNAKNYISTINQRPIITEYKPRLPCNLAKTRALSSFKQDEENREVYLHQTRRRRQQERQTINRFKLDKQQIRSLRKHPFLLALRR